jgi:DsbC/DsbD-like thiol-disulfide interchange protein
VKACKEICIGKQYRVKVTLKLGRKRASKATTISRTDE